MKPSDLSIGSQRCSSAVRTITLTPSGMSTNYVFDEIISDIVDGSSKGFDMVDPFGDRVLVFLQMIGFVADYPASSAVLDVMNHNSRAPCTHCTFRYNTDHNAEIEDHTEKCYSYDTTTTFMNSSHRRGLF